METKEQKDLEVDIGALPLSTINFLLETLNRNPIGAPVMQVAGLISLLQARAQAAVNAAAEAEESAKAGQKTEVADAANQAMTGRRRGK